jgi:NAD(P)-dependent dehydrogenase (short-subunit alcohol dehydrogenase family)
VSDGSGVVVTGGGSGIGRACAQALAEIGRPVAVWDLDGEAAAATAAGLGGTVVATGVDVADPDAVSVAVEEARAALPSIGGLVHAAGIVVVEPVGSIDFANFQRVLDVNLTAFAQLTQALMAGFEAAGPGSAVVGVASIDAFVGHAVAPAYAASKSGMLGLVRSMAAALGPAGIRVNAVCPGYVETAMTSEALTFDGIREQWSSEAALGRVGRPEDIAKVARFLLSDDAGWVTGQSIVADGGVLATI